ncbi:nucleoside-diphosphate kinase [Priestia megaterium]|nr:nucleoside-diphosphate kinase [Priestia megaterium]
MERTFLMVKPDGVRRGLVGEILSRFEQKDFRLVAGKLLQFDTKLVEKHYQEHIGKPFYDNLAAFITSGPCFAFVLEGENVVELARLMMGKTKPTEAAPGTIRGDYANQLTENVIHGSDSVQSAEREIKLFFTSQELMK